MDRRTKMALDVKKVKERKAREKLGKEMDEARSRQKAAAAAISVTKLGKGELPTIDDFVSGKQLIGCISKICGFRRYNLLAVVPKRGIVEISCGIMKSTHDEAKSTKEGSSIYNVGDFYIIELGTSKTKAGMPTGEMLQKIQRDQFKELKKSFVKETKGAPSIDPRVEYYKLFNKLLPDGRADDGDDGGFVFADVDDVADSDTELPMDAASGAGVAPASTAAEAPDDGDVDIDAI